MLETVSKRTRYGTKRYQRARCSVPGCSWRGPCRVKGSKAAADESSHYASEHPRR